MVKGGEGMWLTLVDSNGSAGLLAEDGVEGRVALYHCISFANYPEREEKHEIRNRKKTLLSRIIEGKRKKKKKKKSQKGLKIGIGGKSIPRP